MNRDFVRLGLEIKILAAKMLQRGDLVRGMGLMNAGAAVIRADELADERDLIGAILLDHGAYEIAAEIVEASDFGGPENAAIFRACAAIGARGEAVDPCAVRSELIRWGLLDEAGGDRYIGSTICGLPRTCPVRDLAERIKSVARARAERRARKAARGKD